MWLELLYPRHCPVCDGLLGAKESLICGRCRGLVHFARGPFCLSCGRPVRREESEYCAVCREGNHLFVRAFAPFVYGGYLQNSMMRFKYGGRAEYAGFYAEALVRFGGRLLADWHPDLILPVPIHRTRRRIRGYNQAEEVAWELGRRLGVPADGEACRRVKKTRAQKGLSRQKRRDNLSRAFRLAPGFEPPGRILLVDDIFTTGSTLNELSGVLRAANPDALIYAACVCVSPGMD